MPGCEVNSAAAASEIFRASAFHFDQIAQLLELHITKTDIERSTKYF
jgi:hypothetical protein